MGEQPQWSERTLDMPPQDPWAEPPTAPVRPVSGAPAQPDGLPFSRGRAQVNPHPKTQQFAAEHEPTGTGWPGTGTPRPRRSLGWHVRELRRGGEWSSAAVLFLFVCWGNWAIFQGGSLTTSVIVFVLTLIVAAALFGLARLVGYYVLERQLNRVRRTARGSHLVTAGFLVVVAFAHLQQTTWVMDAYRWVVGLF